MTAEARIPVPFPDIAAEAPGILTEREEMMGVNEVIQSEREPGDEEGAMLGVANSGIDFSSPPEDQPNKREIIKKYLMTRTMISWINISKRRVSNNYMKINCQKSKKMRKKTYQRKQSRVRMNIDDRNETELQTDSIKYQDYELCVRRGTRGQTRL
jgi:hypothetical protein